MSESMSPSQVEHYHRRLHRAGWPNLQDDEPFEAVLSRAISDLEETWCKLEDAGFRLPSANWLFVLVAKTITAHDNPATGGRKARGLSSVEFLLVDLLTRVQHLKAQVAELHASNNASLKKARVAEWKYRTLRERLQAAHMGSHGASFYDAFTALLDAPLDPPADL